MYILKVIKLDKNLPTISYAHEGDAGLDLFSRDDYRIYPKDQRLIYTGIIIKVPEDHVGIIKSRSGMASKLRLHVGAGVIDESYRGEIKVLLRNDSDEIRIIPREMKIAQLLIVPYRRATVEIVEDLEDTDRGDSGFGSTDSWTAIYGWSGK